MPKYTIPILLGTTRDNNQSQKVVIHLQQKISEYQEINCLILDLGKANFPMLTERVTPENSISEILSDWTDILTKAHGLIIVSPEYKSGYPGSLKNFLDYLPPGVFRYKPIGISTVSAGIYAGTSCLQQLRQVIISMAGLVIPDRFQVGDVVNEVSVDGKIRSPQLQKTSDKFVSEMIKYTVHMSKMQHK
ncbi:MAG: NAD(P)H-dependent oxidoreductase [Saprospiraceae bacterium]|nr:NAD(P)H-dependent oxidoreductase [Saprospiraceae bacterium]